jgi:hypothetical protein
MLGYLMPCGLDMMMLRQSCTKARISWFVRWTALPGEVGFDILVVLPDVVVEKEKEGNSKLARYVYIQ